MENVFQRTELIFGAESTALLKSARVAVFGAGGVGGYAIEALARSGLGAIDIIDHDIISPTNINRQILATTKTVGRYKAEVAAERVSEINPDCKVTAHKVFFSPDTAELFDFTRYDGIIDAIDTVTGKLAIIEKAYSAGAYVVSCMGAGNKADPTAFEVADIYETSVCPLAKVMRRELKKRGVPHLKVVYSKELPIQPRSENAEKRVPGSNAFVPPVAGFIAAGEVVKRIIKLL